MKRLLLAGLFVLTLSVAGRSQSTVPIKAHEVDGSPSTSMLTEIVFPNGTLTKSGSGKITYTPAASGGTVTSVSGVNTNGFSFSVSNPTTTPAITLTCATCVTTAGGTPNTLPMWLTPTTLGDSLASQADNLFTIGSTSNAALQVDYDNNKVFGYSDNLATDGPVFLATHELKSEAQLAGVRGGTGVANSGKTITLGGNLVTSGAFATTITSTATTNSTLPAGTHNLAPLDSPTFITGLSSPAITDSGLTAGRVTFAGTGGLLSDDADMTFAADTLTVTKLAVSTLATIPTPFTLGAVSVTATGTELNYSVGVTSAIQTQFGAKAPLASPTFTGTVALPITTVSSTITQTSASATAFESGPNGGTNPVLRIVNSTASQADGISIQGNAAGSGTTITALSSGSNSPIILTPKGTGQVLFPVGATATPGISFTGATTVGFREAAAGIIFTSSSADIWYSSASTIEIRNNGTYGFSSTTDPTATTDLGISRVSAGLIAIGTGAAGSTAGSLSLTGLTASGTVTTNTITGAAANMTITSGTGNSRTMALQTTTSGGVATTALTLNANQSATFAAGVDATGGTFSTTGSFTETNIWTVNSANQRMASGVYFGFSSASDNSAISDVTISRGGVGILNVGSGTTTSNGVIAAGSAGLSSTTDSTTTTSGALQVAGGAAIRKRVFIDGITASSGLQTAVLCQSSGGEMIADSVACLASSARFKENIKPLASGLDEVMRFRPISYRYKAEGIFAKNANFQRERVGFTAEEVARIDPRFVGYEADGKTPRTVGYEQMVPLLVKAIQEQQGVIEGLKGRVAVLERH